MLRNYFKIAFRHLLKSRLYSVINIIGLACGVTCTLLAILYWKDERSFDDFHKSNPHLYRITTSLKTDKEGNRSTIGNTGQVQGPAFKEAVPGIKNYVRIMGGDIFNDIVSENKTLHLRPLFVDTSFFSVFSFKLIKGNPATALKNINGVVITESTAKKFFNSIDVIGKLFSIEADPSYKRLGKSLAVSGVVEDPPGNSSLQFDALLTFEFLRLSFEDHNWLNAYLGTFVVLHPDANIHAVTEKFNAIYALHGKEQVNNLEYNYHGFDPEIKYGLQPMTDIHLNNGLTAKGSNESGIVNTSSPVYSYVFMGIALFILLMAIINFINISIAASLKRAKEVGVRKISGGNSRQIIMQFLLESALLCTIAFVLSILLMNIMLPLLNTMTGKLLLFENVIDWQLVLYFAIVLLAIILLTGFYPAFVLSNFKTCEVLYNKQKQSGRNFFGRGLVVLQFSLAVFLLVAAIVYYTQLEYVRTKDLGYNPYNIIHTEVSGDRDYKSVMGFMKNEMAKEPSIKTVSFGNDGWVEDIEANKHSFQARSKGIDENYLSLMQIPLKLGRNLSTAFATDSKDGALVNEAFVKAAGWKEPIGQTVLINRHYDSSYRRVVGVVKDYHFGSLREPINPLLMYIPESAEGSAGIWINFDRANQRRAMAAVERIYKAAMPKAIYQYNFIDELNAREYLQEKRWQQVVNFSAVLAFVLCCLGLFGLTHLAANRGIKEIGVRKVLGATVSQVVSLLTADFLKLVLISLLIAFPAAWLVMSTWLQNYAYRIEISWWIFMAAGLVAIFIAIITISFQAIKAAITNPVRSLRTE